MPITAANAVELAHKSWQPGSARYKPKPAPTIVHLLPQSAPDPIASDLAQAMNDMLGQLRRSKAAKDKAMLAQALRNLRETYHLVTGQPRPGQIKSVAPRTRSQAYPSPEVIPEPIAIEAQVSSVPMARPNAGCGVQTPTSSVPAKTPDSQMPQGTSDQ